MNDLAQWRMKNQRLIGPRFKSPLEAVFHLGAVQSQDYQGGLWAIGIRSGKTRDEVEQAIAERSIVRTWPMRGTLHFVAARDARWMLKLLTSRVIARAASRLRQLDLDDRTFKRSAVILEKELRGGKHLTRNRVYSSLESAGISCQGQRGIHILWKLAQDGLICFGPHQAKQPAFVLLDEWLPPVEPVDSDTAVARLALRYFAAHGPATINDFIWWSGLPAAGANAALEAVKQQLECIAIDGQKYWLDPALKQKRHSAEFHLLPAYDEYLIGYRNRSAALDPEQQQKAPRNNPVFSPTLLLNGRVIGTWTRLIQKTVVIRTRLFRDLTKAETDALIQTAKTYASFLGVPEASVDLH